MTRPSVPNRPGPATRRWVVDVVWLTAVWVLLWGRLSLANVVSGAAVAALLLAVFPFEAGGARRGPVLRPIPALRLVGIVVADLVVSNLDMSWRVLRPRPGLRTGVVACPLRTRSDGVVTAVASILALGPGTMVVDVTVPAEGDAALLVHVLRADRADAVRRRVARLERSVVAAVGSPAEVAACAAPPGAVEGTAP